VVLIVLVKVLASGHGWSSKRVLLFVLRCLFDSVMMKPLFFTLCQPVSKDLTVVKRVDRHRRAHSFPLLPKRIV
jgi:hypothetical protein